VTVASQRLIQQHGDQIRALAAAGKSRNDIARELNISAGSVTAIAKEIGVSFDRSATATAVRARSIDCKARRLALSERLLDEAEALLDQLHQPFKAFAFGGRDNTYCEHDLPGPPTGDQRNLMQAASTAIGRHIDLTKHDADAGLEAETSLLAALGTALGVTGPPRE
jgi:hypothetical protein